MSRIVVALGVFAVVAVSAIQLVIVRHESRQRFIELQALQEQANQLNKEWGQLLLEQATWGAHSRVEQIAREQLRMVVPPPARVYGIPL
jgi:cell division protein FtsL